MERWGLAAQVEAELERIISLGLLPKDGRLPSERTLASKYRVSREAHGVASLIVAQRSAPEVEVEAHPTLAQVEAASEMVEAHLTLVQAPEVGQPAPEPIQAGGPGALCANWSGHHTSVCEVPPGGTPPAPAPRRLTLLPA